MYYDCHSMIMSDGISHVHLSDTIEDTIMDYCPVDTLTLLEMEEIMVFESGTLMANRYYRH